MFKQNEMILFTKSVDEMLLFYNYVKCNVVFVTAAQKDKSQQIKNDYRNDQSLNIFFVIFRK